MSQMLQIGRIMSVLVFGVLFTLNGSVVGWCSASKSLLLGTSECSIESIHEEHHCDVCEHECPAEHSSCPPPSCNHILSIQLDDFPLPERLPTEQSYGEIEGPGSGLSQVVAISAAHLRPFPRRWARPPPSRHLICVYRL